MRTFLFLLTLTGFLHVYSQEDSAILIRYPNYKVVLYQSKFKFESGNKKDCTYAYQTVYGKYGKSRPWTPTVGEVKDIEGRMDTLISEYSRNHASEGLDKQDLEFIITNIRDYNRRYFSCVDKQGRKIIHIDFNRRSESDDLDIAEKNLFSYIGGGNDHFLLYYDKEKQRVLSLIVNAPW